MYGICLPTVKKREHDHILGRYVFYEYWAKANKK